MLLIVISCFKRFHLTRSRSLYLLLYCCREIIHELCGNTFSPLLIDGAQLTTRHVATVAKCDYNCPYLFRLILLDDEEEEELYDNLCDNLSIITSCRYGVPRLPIPKSTEWISMVLPNISEDRFKMMLRMERATFHALLSTIASNACFNPAENRQHPVAIQLAVVLYRLGASGDGASIGRIAALFGVGDGGTIDIMTRRIFRAILDLESEILHWPNRSEKDYIITETFHEMPHCIGYLDGSEVKLAERPSKDPDSYYSRKQNFAIKLQAVCDYQLKIRHLLVGYPGSVHDSRIFNNSSLFLSPSNYFEGEEWIAADSAYKLSKTIITPFRKNSTEPESMTNSFNKLHSKYRVRIEHCFGILKERFGSLKELRMRLIDARSSVHACNWIRACCILHNFIIDCKEDIQSFDYAPDVDELLDDGSSDNIIRNSTVDPEGELKRKVIYNLMIED